MSSSKSKITVLIAVICLVVVAATVTLVSVLAARQAAATSSFTVSYAASHIKAEITGNYKFATDSSATDFKTGSGDNETTKIEFTSSDASTTGDYTTKSFNAVTGQTFAEDNASVVFTYTIKNTGSTTANEDRDIQISLNNILTVTNLTFKYEVKVGDASSFTEVTGLTNGDSTATPKVDAKKTLVDRLTRGTTVVIQITVSLTDTDVSVSSTDLAFQFNLDRLVPETT